MDQSLQESQLVLSESTNNKLEAILQNQAILTAKTEELQRQNDELRMALEKANSTASTNRKNGKRSSIMVPDLLRVSFH